MGAGLIVSRVCGGHVGGGEEHSHQIAKHLVGLGERITYITTLCPHSRNVVCPDPEELKRWEAHCGYPIERIDTSIIGSGRWNSPMDLFRRLGALWSMYRLVRQRQAEYLIVNQAYSLWRFVARLARIPVINVFHHLAPTARETDGTVGRTASLRSRIYQACLDVRAADVNICVSDATALDVLIAARSPGTKTVVIYNAVDFDAIRGWKADAQRHSETLEALRIRGHSEHTGPVILTVARLWAYKGVQFVIRAMPRILAEFPEARYIIVGDGPYRAELERLAEDTLPLNLRGAVSFAGRVLDSEKYAYYDMCDIFVMPSTAEGFGLVYVEAAAFGKPSIGCDVMGVPEAILDGQTGILVEPEDTDALVEAVLRLLRDGKERLRMGRNGQHRVETKLSWRASAEKYQEIIRDVTKGRRRGKAGNG